MAMVRGYEDEILQRAVRLYRIPGVRVAEVCERLGVSRYALKKACKSFDDTPYPWPRDLLISMLTDTGLRTRGPWPTSVELKTMASYLDFVDKDGSTVESVTRMLAELIGAGIIERTTDGYVLLQPFP